PLPALLSGQAVCAPGPNDAGRRAVGTGRARNAGKKRDLLRVAERLCADRPACQSGAGAAAVRRLAAGGDSAGHAPETLRGRAERLRQPSATWSASAETRRPAEGGPLSQEGADAAARGYSRQDGAATGRAAERTPRIAHRSGGAIGRCASAAYLPPASLAVRWRPWPDAGPRRHPLRSPPFPQTPLPRSSPMSPPAPA